MTGTRRSALFAGILFIFADVAGVMSAVLSKPITGAPDYLSKISMSPGIMNLAAFLELAMGCACVGIAMALYPVLKKTHPGLAVGAVGFRIIEGVFEIAGAVGLLVLVTIGVEFSKAVAQSASYLRTLGDMLQEGRGWMSSIGRQTGWSLGALMYYAVMFRSRLVPRWLAGWAFIGNTATLAASALYMFNIVTPWSTADFIFTFPAGAAELVLAIWLIAKGFYDGPEHG
jgi:hypothetical protein